MSLRQTALDLAILGRLMQGPSHGYEIRKHVNLALGYLQMVSFGSLYPALRRLLDRELICDCGGGLPRRVAGRSRRIYHITPLGEEHLVSQLVDTRPDTFADALGIRFSLLGLIDGPTRLRILNALREYTASRLNAFDSSSRSVLDHYSQELVRHSRDVVNNELAWLDRVIAAEESITDKEIR